MVLVNTDAIVLRTYNLAEADRTVVCLTRSSGLVRAVAKGARRMKSRFGAAFEPFTLVRLAFYEKENRELVKISRAEIIKSNFDLAARLELSELFGYIAELVSEFAPPHEANEKLFRMVTACVEGLEFSPESANLIQLYFEIWLLRLAGLFPDMKICARCGLSLEDQARVYIDSEGAARCDECGKGLGSVVSADSRQTLNLSQRLGPLEFVSAQSSSKTNSDSQLGDFAHKLISRALERRLRTVLAHTLR